MPGELVRVARHAAPRARGGGGPGHQAERRERPGREGEVDERADPQHGIVVFLDDVDVAVGQGQVDLGLRMGRRVARHQRRQADAPTVTGALTRNRPRGAASSARTASSAASASASRARQRS